MGPGTLIGSGAFLYKNIVQYFPLHPHTPTPARFGHLVASNVVEVQGVRPVTILISKDKIKNNLSTPHPTLPKRRKVLCPYSDTLSSQNDSILEATSYEVTDS